MINAPFYDSYIARVKDSDILATLEEQMNSTYELLNSIGEDKGNYAYEPGKWTIKELVGHLADSERVFGYRALRFSRKDKTEIAGYEQDDYVANSNFNDRTLKDLADELLSLRKSNLILFRSFTDDMLKMTGVANGSEVSVDALLYIIAGHEKHHINVIKEKYLN